MPTKKPINPYQNVGHCVRIILPGGLKNEAHTKPFYDSIIKKWGGLTVLPGFGYWSPDSTDLPDQVDIAECSVGVWDTPTQYWWTDLCREARKVFNEECIYLSVREERAVLIWADKEERIG